MQRERNKSMDTLRATAIMMVLVAHAVYSYGAPSALAPLQMFGMGVDLFFVLSGWLLGSALIKEQKRNEKIDVKRFWVRRWMRTLPAYYAVLFALSMQQWLTKNNFSFPFEYIFFYQNYQMPLNYFSISWSLAVEEQFYLIIAPLLATLARLKKRVGLAVLFTIFFMPFVFREVGVYEHLKQTHVRLDCCAFGVLLAYFYHHYNNVWKQIERWAIPIAICLTVVLLTYLVNRYISVDTITSPDKLLLALTFGSYVVLANSKEYNLNDVGGNISCYIATRSYSMYLLHPEALALTNKFAKDQHFIFYFIVMMLFTCLLSEVLYRVIELPGMNLRNRFKSLKLNKRGIA